MRDCLIQLLSKWGYQIVLVATNGQELISEITQDTLPDICIIDIGLPLLVELETCKLIREKWPCILILALTMNIVPSLTQKLKGHADGVLSKADSILEIKSVLENLKKINQISVK